MRTLFSTIDRCETDIASQVTARFERLSLLAKQREKVPDYHQRMASLLLLEQLVLSHVKEIAQAIHLDFGYRAYAETAMLEVYTLIDEIRYIRKHLQQWMKKQKVKTNFLFQPSQSYIVHQPLGVVGIFGAFNYPFLLSLAPLIAAVAAGNRVMLKPSSLTPNIAALIEKLMAKVFSKDEVFVVIGDSAVGKLMSELPFNHLFFTGSKRVAKDILQSAAQNLTPVTLELGGKSPAIIGPDANLEKAVESICYAKFINAGQTCVAPDYVLLEASKLDEFISLAKKKINTLYPQTGINPDYTNVVNKKQYSRLQGMLQEAVDRGCNIEIVNFNQATHSRSCCMSPTLVWNCPDDIQLLEQEIFGPILPIITYTGLDSALDWVNRRPTPLALYYFDENKKNINRVINGTASGGVTVNGCVFHVGQHTLPFGGIGESGMGRYHGFFGFETFSHKRAIFEVSRWISVKAILPPYKKQFEWLLGSLLKKKPYRLTLNQWFRDENLNTKESKE